MAKVPHFEPLKAKFANLIKMMLLANTPPYERDYELIQITFLPTDSAARVTKIITAFYATVGWLGV